MGEYDLVTVGVFSIASATLTVGFVFGWIWAWLHIGGSSHSSNRSDKED